MQCSTAGVPWRTASSRTASASRIETTPSTTEPGEAPKPSRRRCIESLVRSMRRRDFDDRLAGPQRLFHGVEEDTMHLAFGQSLADQFSAKVRSSGGQTPIHIAESFCRRFVE